MPHCRAVLYAIFPAVLLGAVVAWIRLRKLRHITGQLRAAFHERKIEALATSTDADNKARATGSSVVTLMGDLKSVYRFKDVRHVSMLSREMRKWDEDGIPDPEAVEYGEFILKVCTNSALFVQYIFTFGG